MTTAPIFSGPTSCWTPIAVTNPGKQTSALGTAVSLARPGRRRLAQRDARLPGRRGLPAGLSINPASGVISGRPTATGKKHVTVTVSDSVDSATVTFVWVVKRH